MNQMISFRRLVKALLLFWPVPYFVIFMACTFIGYLRGSWDASVVWFWMGIPAIVWGIAAQVLLALHINANSEMPDEERANLLAAYRGKYWKSPVKAQLLMLRYVFRYIIK